VSDMASRVSEAQVSWVRYNGVFWSEVEATQGTYDWSKLSAVEGELRLLQEKGATPLVIVRGTPNWAQKVAGKVCGPIKEEFFDNFATFMSELVKRYSTAPYNVRYWELWNEPDASSEIASDSPFGCWGEPAEDYYGGGFYAKMLKKVYPKVKEANPDAQIVLGGLLLDCDPSKPPTGKDCKSTKFFEGILNEDGGNYFDLAAFHGYAYYHWWLRLDSAGNATKNIDWGGSNLPSPQDSWNSRGGPLLGKVDFLTKQMAQYGSNKPIIANEIGLLCYTSEDTAKAKADCRANGYWEQQANYALRTYIRAWANKLVGAVWYTLNESGWQDSGLITDSQPREAYRTLKFITEKFKEAKYKGALAVTSDKEIYEFEKSTTNLQIYWTNNDSKSDIPVPTKNYRIYNKFGDLLEANTTNLVASFEPIILEIDK